MVVFLKVKKRICTSGQGSGVLSRVQMELYITPIRVLRTYFPFFHFTFILSLLTHHRRIPLRWTVMLVKGYTRE